MSRNFNASVLMHMKLLFLFMVCLILWLFTNSAKKKIHHHGIDVILAGVESHHWQFLQMSFKLKR
jgi:hypothetical protein